jgi:hypothetical protein
MGLSLEFYAGDAQTIGTAFTEVEFDKIRDGRKAAAYADLSLHLSPEDLDLLSTLAAEHLNTPPLLLWECLNESVGSLDEGETGEAWTVDPRWVGMVAALQDQDASPLTARWIARMADLHGETLEVTEDAVRAVGSLIQLCRRAAAEGVDVVLAWYL